MKRKITGEKKRKKEDFEKKNKSQYLLMNNY